MTERVDISKSSESSETGNELFTVKEDGVELKNGGGGLSKLILFIHHEAIVTRQIFKTALE